jgi:hypothetical protein
MAKKRGKQIYTKDDLEKAIIEIDNAPEKPTAEVLKKTELIEQLAGKLLSLQDKGYDWDEMAILLGKAGIEISGNSLRLYLRAKRGETPPAKPAKPSEKMTAPEGFQVPNADEI